jgi:6-phosphogluconolactonase (cycloisomerase 2 family)
MQNCTWATKAALLTGVIVAWLFTFGCGGGNNSAMTESRNTYAYVALADQFNGVGCLAQFQVSSSGTLTPLSPATLGANEAIPFGRGPLAVDPSGQYLFLAGYGGYEVSQYVIGSDGTISLNANPYPSNVMLDPVSITFTGSGLAIVTNGGVLNSYSLSPAGTLTPLNTAPVTNANSIVIDPTGQFLYIDDEANSAFAVYTISTDGTLTLNGTIPSPEIFPWLLVFSPKGMLYSVDYGAGTITQYSIDASTGIPTKVNTFTTGSGAGTSQPQGLAFNSTGGYAYVTNAFENTVSQFAVDATTGAFRKNGADVVTGRAPSPIAVDPSGRFVFVANLVDATISEFIINEDGTLSPNGVVAGGPNPLNPDTPSPVAIAFSQR